MRRLGLIFLCCQKNLFTWLSDKGYVFRASCFVFLYYLPVFRKAIFNRERGVGRQFPGMRVEPRETAYFGIKWTALRKRFLRWKYLTEIITFEALRAKRSAEHFLFGCIVIRLDRPALAAGQAHAPPARVLMFLEILTYLLTYICSLF